MRILNHSWLSACCSGIPPLSELASTSQEGLFSDAEAEQLFDPPGADQQAGQAAAGRLIG